MSKSILHFTHKIGYNNGHENRIALERSTYVNDVHQDMYLNEKEKKLRKQYIEGIEKYLSSYELDEYGCPIFHEFTSGVLMPNPEYLGKKHAYRFALRAYNAGASFEKNTDENKQMPLEYMTLSELEEIGKQEMFDQEKSQYRIFFENGRTFAKKEKDAQKK